MTACLLILLLLVQLAFGNLECNREITVNTNGNDAEDCLEGDYPCSSLGYVLNHLQSNDCVNITSNSVPFTTIVELHNLNAITIRGQGNTVVMCNNTGGVSCNNCSNVAVEEITWDSCGDPNLNQTYSHSGGVNFHEITNLSISNCTFQHSSIRGLSITLPFGLIKIVYTHFLYNANYGTIYCAESQHGFIQCTSEDFKSTGALRIEDVLKEATFNITNCLFDHNGHFGYINDTSYRNVPCFNCEVADGAGLYFVSRRPNIAANMFIENTVFSFNRGRSGAGALIRTRNSSHIVLSNVVFLNNSVLKFYVNASALTIHQDQAPWNDSIEMSTIQLSSCVFHNNSGGRNMLSYNIADIPSHIVIENCTFFNNSQYDITMVELNLKYMGSVDILDSNFDSNTGSALIYFQIRNSNIAVSIHNVAMKNNEGFATEKIGGLVLMEVSQDNCTLQIAELIFEDNRYFSNGGGIYISGAFESIFKGYVENSQFKNNSGFGDGTVIYSSLRCATEKTYLMFIDNCTFADNQGNSIVYVSMEYYILPAFLILNGNFSYNIGTPLKLFNVLLVGKGSTVFEHNQADTGAALYLSDSYILLNYSSYQFSFVDNSANQHGGAIFVDFVLSNAVHSQCHWLFYPQNDFCSEIFHKTNNCTTVIYTQDFCKELPKSDIINLTIDITDNTALLSGQAIFYDDANNFQIMGRSSNTSDPNSMFYIPEGFTLLPNATEPLVLATQPHILQLEEPAKCNNDSSECTITGITLGQEIRIPAKIIGYNNKPAEATRFFIKCTHNCNHHTSASHFVLITDELRGINFTGDEVTQNASVSLELHSGMTRLSLNIDLVGCQLGYVYDTNSHQCLCYQSDDNTVTCVDNSTTIRREYWFGKVDGSRTVSKCPEKYCNFSRNDEATPGRYVLPVGYDDQCNKHREGPACGQCSDNYTLSFDFNDCVNKEDCSIGITFVIIICTILYWILIVVISLGVMYFKINLGYLYGIIYYYSVVDILLGQIVHFSSGLDIVEKVIYSIVRLSPGFLGKLCFIEGMSGIDQYALHYVHPTAISLILVLLAVFARCSRRFALFISRGIIHVICLILILTYTSIADTSLQLFRWLRYEGNDNIYCYLSPHMKYLNGRHIVYFSIAVLFELVVVLGLPLLLLVEPFINSRINFIRIKPILDQFQGCYKDKYRWFAAIYFLCRQLILFIVVITSDQYISLYLLAVVCVVLALSHFLLRPYANNALNQYDGTILQLLLLVVSLQIISVSESGGFQDSAISGVAYGLLFLPLLAYIILSMYIKKDAIYSVMRCLCGQHCGCLHKEIDSGMVPTAVLQESHPLVSRRNINLRTMQGSSQQQYNQYQESLLNYDHVD